ncbi:TRAP transporter solute receptor, TAXI family [Halanaeroarchaeum sulfurireducens]|uniref:TRAP transporter solute receptor, TAXI family n=1 Tax=Halanaeroarchaeum sulfurireducens TaxID=1604004 RepID=A0A0F7PB30_9EURY|nr:TAXI family TRAP transporter solute-binding subunit [Halanaeroarchaeum sulfurireducens]AKH96548.1 TRAP transporter solute receptor, TAXI family [Halanaeroarchaeum sulfurireducens]
MSMENLNRRDLLKGAATLGVITTAGCTGGNGDDDGEDGGGESYQVTIGATSSNSSSQAAAQALARAANEHSDTVSISPQVTDGWTANLYEYDSGNIPAMAVDNNSLSKAINEEGPFADDPVDTLPQQGFMFTSLQIHWVGLEGSGLESTADLEEGGYTIYPIQPGFGTRLLTEEVIKEAGIWEQNEIYNGDTGDVPGAVEEGRVDALCVYGANGVELSGWVQEVDVRSNEGLYLLEVDDNFRQAIKDVPGAILEEFEPYGYEQDVSKITDTVVSWSLAAQWAFGPDIPAEATKEIARLAHEHHDTIRESDPTTLDYSDPEVMTTTVIPELEIHPGVAEFFQENDIWSDDWTSA